MFFHDLGSEIPYNFLIGGDGNVYEGRGFSTQGELDVTSDIAGSLDDIGICVGVFLDENSNFTGENVLRSFLDDLIKRGFVSSNYSILLDSYDSRLQPFIKNYYQCKSDIFLIKEFYNSEFLF